MIDRIPNEAEIFEIVRNGLAETSGYNLGDISSNSTLQDVGIVDRALLLDLVFRISREINKKVPLQERIPWLERMIPLPTDTSAKNQSGIERITIDLTVGRITQQIHLQLSDGSSYSSVASRKTV